MLLIASLVALRALTSGSLSTTNGAGDMALARTYITAYSTGRLVALHAKIPAWARKYNVNCSACHSPVMPRLNETGQRFKWAGYRMPEEIGENVDVGKIQNYVAAGTNLHYDWEKTEGNITRTNGFSLPSVTVFYAGPFGRNLSGFLELEHGNGEFERVAQISAVWGNQKKHGGFRVGQMHYLAEWGLGGFDRPVGIEAPLAIAGPITNGVPFAFGEHQLAIEAFFVSGRNRLSAQILNGLNAAGMGTEAADARSKDFLITDALLLDHSGSGVQAVVYVGGIRGLDSTTANADLRSKFWRVGITANKVFDQFEALGALIYGRDSDLPLGPTSPFTDSSVKGLGWWLAAQYVFLREKETTATLFGRYEQINPNTALADAKNRRLVAGLVLPINLPQYLRGAIEYRRDFPQGGARKTNGISAELWLNF